jgi:NAD(P)H-nitrite reductase large subunit
MLQAVLLDAQPSPAMPQHFVIVGNGIAGVTAARMIRKASRSRITMVSEEGLHPYARTSLMYVFMGQVRWKDTWLYEEGFYRKNRIERVHDRVVDLDASERTLTLRDGGTMDYDRLLLATGSSPFSPGWPGDGLGGVHHLWGIADVERIEQDARRVRHAVVVGGGLTGVELAEMLRSRGIGVTFLVRDERFMGAALPPEESELVEAEIRAHGVDLRLGEELAAIEGDAQVAGVVTGGGERIAAQAVGLTVGVRPNLSALGRSGIETARGILVDKQMRTSHRGVWAAGDCAEHRNPPPGVPPVEQLWYSARRQGVAAARSMLGAADSYRRGVFFNSAKFFRLEWQQYGTVPAELPPELGTVVWQDVSGPLPRLVLLVYDRSGGRFRGLAAIGVRYRQDVCTGWILQGRTLGEVVDALGEANFDPEFTRRPERAFQDAFHRDPDRFHAEPELVLA